MNTGKLKYVIYSLLIYLNSIVPVSGQIVPDNTLGAESSIVNQIEILKQQIEGGAIRGENLFHSFTEFNVGNGESVHFVNPQSVSNILTRVTGNNLSQIMGILGVNGNANLFLLNPNGFVFGKNASLDLNGSFIATTGDIQLGEEGFFSATDTQGSSLLSVKPEVIFSNVQNKIENRATLAVKEGNNIILIAEGINNIGNLTAPKGEIILQGNKVNIIGNSQVDVSANDGGGEIKIQGQEEINIGENVSLKADALLMGDGGKIELISSGKIEFLGNISARGENAGEVIIEGAEVINNGEIDLGAENSENQENTIAPEDETNENTIAPEDETNENTIASEEETNENTIASEEETNKNTIALEDETNGNAIASEEETNKNAIAPEDETTENTIALESQTSENNVGANGISPNNVQITAANPRLEADTTLGNENSQIETIDESNDRVIGGAERGANLFHSFGEFNIETGKGVHFANPEGINNILARVTGNNISEMRGTLGVEGSADLYFINPNGLFFNQNASLDLNGSFFASTAEAIIFNEFEYSAVNPNIPPNLVVSVPTGLRFGDNPGDIILKNEETIVQEQGDAGDLVDTAQSVNDNNTSVPDKIQGDLTGGNDADLYQVSLEANKPFNASTVGGSDVDTRLFLFDSQGLGIDANEDQDVPFSFQSTLSEFTPTESGTYYLGISSHANAPESIDGEIFAFNFNTFAFEGLGEGGNSPLSSWNQDSRVNEGGYVITLSNGNETQPTGNLGVNPGQNLALIGGNVTVEGVEIISLGSNIIIGGLNQAGIVNINPDLSLSFPQAINRGDLSLINSTVLDVAGNNGGNITLNGQNININDSQVLAGIGEGNGFENAQAGDIKLDVTETLRVENSFIFNNVNFNAVGNSGKVRINAQDIIIKDALVTSGIGGVGNSGGIEIETNTLELTNGGQIFASVFGQGDADSVTISATDITVDGESSDGFPSGIFSTVQPEAEGNNEGIEIETNTLSVENGGKISANIFGQGNAETLTIEAIKITIDGQRSDGFPSGIFSQVEAEAEGNSGGIEIETNILSVNNGGQISAGIFGQGNAGAVNIEAIEITIDRQRSDGFSTGIFSQVEAEAEGNSGGIEIATDKLFLNNGGEISASTLGQGNAGLVKIKAIEITLDGETLNLFPSRILSGVDTEAEGNSGGIEIATDKLFLNNGGEINASTRGKGDAGLVKISATDITLDGETINALPSAIHSIVEAKAEGNSGGIEITTDNLSLKNGAEIDASTFGRRNAGMVNIRAIEITLDGENSNGFTISSIFSTVQPEAEGNSGGIEITTDKLSLKNGAEINAGTFGQGNAGLVKITATGITIDGETRFGEPSGIFSGVDTEAEGNSEGIEITTDSLFLKNGGAINASTFGEGDAGTIDIKASEQISLSGTAFLRDLNREIGGISAFTLTTKKAGDIFIETPKLTISEGASIESFTQGQGEAGDININATESLILNTDTKLIVESTDAGTAGDINIDTPLLTIGENAKLSATATETSTAEKAGDINLKVNQLNISGELGIFAETQSTPEAGSLTIQPYETNPNINIEFTENGFISARTTNIGDGGSITITAPENIDIRGLGSITAETFGSGKAGNIDIDTQNLTIADGVTITTSTESSGNAGLITLNATENIFLTNEVKITSEVREGATGTSEGIVINTPILSISDRSQISAATQGEKKAGDITINATDSVTIDDKSLLNVQTDSIGKAGNIQITTNTLTIGEDSELSAKTTINATGDAGTITIKANFLDITGKLGIFAETDGIADAGSLNINPNDNSNLAITFFDEGQISASTSNAGDGGDINIKAPQTIELKGNGTIKVETTGTGKAGDINFKSPQLNISEGVTISALTSGEGEAGSINLEIGDEILIDSGTTFTVETDGEKDAGDIELTANKITIGEDAELSARSNQNATGKAGNIELNTNQLTIFGDKGIFAETFGEGDAGSIIIKPLDKNLPLAISFFDDGNISASTSGSGKGGNIEIKDSDVINISGDGNIQVEANSSGEAGSIIINADNQINLSNEINISASTFSSGKAGNINLSAPNSINILGDGIIKVETAGSGDAGSILIESNEINLSEGITLSASTSNIGNSQDVILTGNLINLDNATIQALTTGEGNPGSILISNGENQANQVNLTNNSIISTEINAEGNRENALPADITINTNNLSLESSKITASTSANRDAGNITIPDAQNINLINNSKISASTDGSGDAGEVNFNANNINLNNSQIEAFTTSSGEGGNINIPNSENLNLVNNSEISASTSGEGFAGSIDLNVNQTVNIDSGSQLKVETESIGDAGDIEIDTPILTIGENAELSAVSKNTATGIAGNITLNTNQLNISGELGIFAETEGEADAGKLTINPLEDNPNLNINFSNEGNISASTSGSGDGGDIKITAPETIIISGDGIIKVETNGSGDAGSILIESHEINLTDGIEISASTSNLGNSKEITLEGNLINLDDATIKALTTGEGNPGSILISNGENNANQVKLTNNSTISTEIKADGDRENAQPAANIKINSDNLSLDSSTITASTTANRDGGKIEILDSEEINLTNQSEITAFTSGSGKAGNIDLNVETEIKIDSGSKLNVETNSSGKAGNIDITTNTLTIGEESELTAKTTENATGKAGNITINANLLYITGELGIFAETEGEADAGSLNINPKDNPNLDITFFNEGQISASTSGAGKGGNIEITSPSIINISGDGVIKVETDNSGEAGNIKLTANTITIREKAQLSAITTNNATGIAGNINLDARELNLDNAIISAFTEGRGNPGSIVIGDGDNNANQINLTDNSIISTEIKADGNRESAQPANITINSDNLSLDASKITASTSANRDAGNINIHDAENINLINNSEISASTNGIGKAGNINLSAPNTINISGDGIIKVETNGSGFAGTINIDSQNLSLTDGIEINASTFASGNSGDINLFADNINLDNATIQAITESSGKGGNINIPNSENLNLVNNSEITASTTGEGFAGSIDLNVNQAVSIDSGSQLKVETESIGDAGNIEIDTPILTIGENAELSAVSKNTATGIAGKITLNTNQLNISGELGIFAETEGVADAGNLTINPLDNNPNLTISFSRQGNISASTFGSGNGGDININADETINISGDGIIKVETNGSGDAGSILIESHEINLTDGIEISASTSNLGNSKEITLEGNLINLDDATIKALTTGEGNPGSILISNRENNNANQVNLTNNSIISTEIKAQGNRESAQPANITINSENLFLQSSQITASTNSNRDAGNINITSENLNLVNNSEINTLSQGEGDAGNINLDVNGLFTATDGNISANANQAGGGKITINAQNIRLRGDSDIRTNVNSGAGDGGNITITADSIINFDDSDIFAFARDGRGGNISLNTPVFLGDGYQPGDSDSVNDPNTLDGNGKVDLNATGAVSGVILIPDTTFIQKSLVQLPESFIDPESLIANTCIVPNSRQQGTFIIKGAGGLPISPGKPSISPYPTGTVQPLSNTNYDNQSGQKGESIIQPQGILKNTEGKLMLTRQCQ